MILGPLDCSFRRIHPRSAIVAWIANLDAWIDELQLRARSPARLENADEPFGVEVLTEAPGIRLSESCQLCGFLERPWFSHLARR